MAEITCPWCGDEADETPEDLPWWPVNESGTIETVCGGCDQPITIRRIVEIRYLVTKREPEAR